MSFGKTLAALREAAGMTQDQLAKQAGLKLDTLRGWEQERSLPRVDDAYRLAKALGVGVDELIRSEDMDPPPPDPGQGGKRKKKGGVGEHVEATDEEPGQVR